MTTISVGGLLVLGVAIGVSFKLMEAALDRLVAPVVLNIAPKSVVRIYDGLKRRDYRDNWEER